MTSRELHFSALVLAGERPGGSEFSHQLGLAASVLVEVAGKPSIARVLEALQSSELVKQGLLVGPAAEIFDSDPRFPAMLAGSGLRWIPPGPGPSASVMVGLEALEHYPVFITAADHALLTGQIIDGFCRVVANREEDIIVGLVPFGRVKQAYPDTKRTVLKFSDGQFCGSNLFAIQNPQGLAGPRFWQEVEAYRKRPWRMVWRLGPAVLWRYLTGRLALQGALKALCAAMGCQVGVVIIDNPRAAVDVDSLPDLELAERILRSDAARNRGV